MRLVVVSDDFPEINHPSYVFVEQLVIALCDLDVKVCVIAPQSFTKRLIRGTAYYPKYKKNTTPKGNLYEVYRPYYVSAGTVKLLQRFYYSSLKRAVERVLNKIGHNNVDVLYGHFWHNAYSLLKYSIKYFKPLYVACGEGDNAIEELLDTLSPYEKEILSKTVRGVISVSSENRKKIIKYGLADENRIEVFPNAVDKSLFFNHDRISIRERWGIKDTDFVICFVGGFINRKGSNRLSDAITELNDSCIKSFFIGEARSYDDCTPNCPGILYTGPIAHDLLPEYLSASDAFVLPTLNEGCCNAIVEAICCGLPVVSSNLPFNDDILDQTNSLRIDPMNVDEIKDAIVRLKTDPSLRASLSKGSLHKSKSLSIEERAKKIIDFIESKS